MTVLFFTHFSTTSAERFKALTELVLVDEREAGVGSEASDGSTLGKRNMVITLPLHAICHLILYFLRPSSPLLSFWWTISLQHSECDVVTRDLRLHKDDVFRGRLAVYACEQVLVLMS